MNSEPLDPIPLSALQHWAYCPRQCALIHVEQVFEENLFTQRGQALHKRVDNLGNEGRGLKQALKAHEAPGSLSPLASSDVGTSNAQRLARARIALPTGSAAAPKMISRHRHIPLLVSKPPLPPRKPG